MFFHIFHKFSTVFSTSFIYQKYLIFKNHIFPPPKKDNKKEDRFSSILLCLSALLIFRSSALQLFRCSAVPFYITNNLFLRSVWVSSTSPHLYDNIIAHFPLFVNTINEKYFYFFTQIYIRFIHFFIHYAFFHANIHVYHIHNYA